MASFNVHPDNTPERFIHHLLDEYNIYTDYRRKYHMDNINNPKYLYYGKLEVPPMESFRDFVKSRFFGDNQNMNILRISRMRDYNLSVDSIYSVNPDNEEISFGKQVNNIIKKFLSDFETEFEYYDQENYVNLNPGIISRSYHPGRHYGSGEYGDNAKEMRFQDFVMKRLFRELDEVIIPPRDEAFCKEYSFDDLQGDA